MECPNCQFQNMPGTANCARCGTSMTLKNQAIDVHPPRATRWSRPLQRFRFFRNRLQSNASAALARLEPRVPSYRPPTDNFTAPILVRCLIPGWPQFYLKRPVRGYVFSLGALFMFLMAVTFVGTGTGSVCLGLLFSCHAGSIADALTPPRCVLSQSLSIGIGTYIVLGALVYLPAMNLMGRIARPMVLQNRFPPYHEGDVLWTRNLPLQRGNTVVYRRQYTRLTIDGHHFVALNPLGLDRILATQGDVVSSDGSSLKINGVVTPLRPLNLEHLPIFEMTVPVGHVMIWPSEAADVLRTKDWDQAIFIQNDNITGTAVFQSYPWTRFGFVH